jgi:hypothetical protein
MPLPRTTPSNRKREPISVSVREALELVPFRVTSLYAAMKSGEIKSRMVGRRRVIDYQSLKKFAGVE